MPRREIAFMLIDTRGHMLLIQHDDTSLSRFFVGIATQHRDELSKFVGEEISRTLLEQRRLEGRYEELIAQRAALRGVVNKAR